MDVATVSETMNGIVLLWRHEHDAALASHHRSSECDPNYAQGHTSLGVALMYSGWPRETLGHVATAMRLNPHYPNMLLHFLAQAHFSLGQYETAANHVLDRMARKSQHRCQPHVIGGLLRSARARV
jgi:adenylate cyclase